RPIQTVREFFVRASSFLRDVLIDLIRKHQGRDNKRPAMLPIHPGDSASDERLTRFDPESQTHDPVQAAFWTAFHEEVERLPEKLRQVVDLFWYQDLSHQEIACVLGIAEVTSRSWWAEARTLLKQRFPDTPFDWNPA